MLGISALLLACLGIVGLVAYSVSQRTKEIGIRMALGATGSHVLSVVLRQLSRPVVAGLLLGIAGAAGLSQVLRRELYGVSNLDPLAYGAAIGAVRHHRDADRAGARATRVASRSAEGASLRVADRRATSPASA